MLFSVRLALRKRLYIMVNITLSSLTTKKQLKKYLMATRKMPCVSNNINNTLKFGLNLLAKRCYKIMLKVLIDLNYSKLGLGLYRKQLGLHLYTPKFVKKRDPLPKKK